MIVLPDTDHLFTGQRFEADLDLYDFGARFYDPELSRFLSPDPILAPIGRPELLNPYSYVLNAPLEMTGPTPER